MVNKSRQKNIIILSEKSSGSSACQNLLSKFKDINHITRTRHYESETLYWTKAASVLRKPQLKMVDSEVPIEPDRARNDLITLLKENLDNYIPPTDDKELITQGWNLLCKKYAPIFLEKSPHHLCQWSALELILEHIQQTDDVDFLLVGIIRNPMDTIYSQYRRWKSPPEKVEKQWKTAYRNLLRLKDLLGDKLIIIHYEDMVSSINSMEPVLDFCGISTEDCDTSYLHKKSIQKWKKDKLFGFSLSSESIELAGKYGYKKSELINKPILLWHLMSRLSRLEFIIAKTFLSFYKNLSKKLKMRPGIY